MSSNLTRSQTSSVMAFLHVSSGMRILGAHLRALQEIFLYGHGEDGSCLPQVPATCVRQHILPFLALPKVSDTLAAAGYSHICAVQCDGRLICFGRNTYGQCDVPADLGPLMAVAAGAFHTCALQCDGRLICFGHNTCGQCNVPADLVLASSICLGVSERLEALVEDTFEGIADNIEHTEPPTVIAPTEASDIVAEQHVSWLVHNMDSVVRPGHSGFETEVEPVLLLQFSRSSKAFQSALSTSPTLEPVHAALADAGCRAQLPSGATILTDPTHFNVVYFAVRGRTLQPCHAIVTESLEPLVHEVVNGLPCKQKIRLRRAESVGYVQNIADEEARLVLVQRTFIEVPQAIIRSPVSVIQSTTEAIERHATIPRRRIFQ